MGSHSDLACGFVLTTEDIDTALGVYKDYPGRPAATTQETRYNSKTGAPIVKNKRIPAIPAFRHITITYGGELFVDRIYAIPDGSEKSGRMPTPPPNEALIQAGLPLDWKEKSDYPSLMEALSADNCFECEWDYNTFIIRINSYCSKDFLELAWFDQPTIRAEIAQLANKLQGLGFKDPKYGFTSVFYE